MHHQNSMKMVYMTTVTRRRTRCKTYSCQQVDYLEQFVDKYPIITIEDGMDENDWDGWKQLTERIGDHVRRR